MTDWSALAGMAAETVRDTFGQLIQYQRISADPEASHQDVQAVFQNAATSVDLGTVHIPLAGTNPTLFVLEADIGYAPAQGDRAIVAGETWTVVDVHPDGYGGFKLELHRGAKVRW